MITVHAGEMFDVEFRATPATGYQWQLAGSPTGVELVGDSFNADTGKDPAPVPVGGTQAFHFLAGESGNTTLHFVLKRSWESAFVEQHEEEVVVLP
ncbi:protease inhibitor I42 family protein [Arthrobacter sp. LAPM80]|uniref:protease inhibitor I42 family protein n=1 Tax=Arthrobacter sp. LAPM80 TaxID=3141788 RepID=UPI00398AB48C